MREPVGCQAGGSSRKLLNGREGRGSRASPHHCRPAVGERLVVGDRLSLERAQVWPAAEASEGEEHSPEPRGEAGDERAARAGGGGRGGGRGGWGGGGRRRRGGRRGSVLRRLAPDRASEGPLWRPARHRCEFVHQRRTEISRRSQSEERGARAPEIEGCTSVWQRKRTSQGQHAVACRGFERCAIVRPSLVLRPRTRGIWQSASFYLDRQEGAKA